MVLFLYHTFAFMEHSKRKITDYEPKPRVKYRFSELEVGESFSILVKKHERDRAYHSCRTRCKQASIDGKLFQASVDDTRVYYKRIA